MIHLWHSRQKYNENIQFLNFRCIKYLIYSTGARWLESHTHLYKLEGYMNIRPTLKNGKIILRYYMRSSTLHEYTILLIRLMFGV